MLAFREDEVPGTAQKTISQLPITLGLDIFAIQPYFVNGGIVSKFNAFIIGPFLKFLGRIEIFLINNYQFF